MFTFNFIIIPMSRLQWGYSFQNFNLIANPCSNGFIDLHLYHGCSLLIIFSSYIIVCILNTVCRKKEEHIDITMKCGASDDPARVPNFCTCHLLFIFFSRTIISYWIVNMPPEPTLRNLTCSNYGRPPEKPNQVSITWIYIVLIMIIVQAI